MKTKILSALFIHFVSGFALASPVPDFPFIQGDGKAKRDVPPTHADVTFKVLAFAKSSEESTNTVQAALTKVIATLKEHGVKDEQLKAGDLQKLAVRNRASDSYAQTEITGYEVYRTVSLKVPDLKSYPTIVSALMKAENVGSVGSEFESSKRDEVETELIGEACSKARKRADALAKGAGVKIASVYAVNSYGFNNLHGSFGFSYEPDVYGSAGEGPLIPLFVPASITIETQLSILYKLEP